jgi:hypothetical protein
MATKSNIGQSLTNDNVGIGVVPVDGADKLQVGGNSELNGVLEVNSTQNVITILGNRVVGQDNTVLQINKNGNLGEIHFQVFGSDSAGARKINFGRFSPTFATSETVLTIDNSSKNVGFGTTTPNSRITSVIPSSGIALELQNIQGDTNVFVDLKMIAGNNSAGTLGTILRHKRNGSSGGDFFILTSPTLSGVPLERLVVTKDGNVGIGTTTPTEKLHVIGNALISGVVKISGSGIEGPLFSDFVLKTLGNVDSEGFLFKDANNLTIASIFRNGNALFSGSVTAASYITSSDENLKDIISTDGDVIKYKWKNKQDDLVHIGYSAQEKREFYPDAVHENAEGFLALNYIEILVDKIRSLEKSIELLQNK